MDDLFYLDRLDSQVVVEDVLIAKIASMLLQEGFSGMRFEKSGAGIDNVSKSN